MRKEVHSTYILLSQPQNRLSYSSIFLAPSERLPERLPERLHSSS